MRFFLSLSLFLLLPFCLPAKDGKPPVSFTNLRATKVADGFRFTEGPVWIRDGGYWLFSDIPANRIYKLAPGKKTEIWRADSGQSNGLTLDRQGRLLCCEHHNRRITRTEKDGSITVLAEYFEGKRFNSPNDAVVGKDGSILFTDPTYGLKKRPAELPFKGVFRRRNDGTIELLFRDFNMPNGIVFSPEGKRLYIADTPAGHVRCFSVKPDGSFDKGKVFAEMKGPDGIRIDRRGNLYATCKKGVAIFSPDGRELGVITCLEQPANCAFGGKDGKTMLITARKGVYRVRLPIPGIVP